MCIGPTTMCTKKLVRTNYLTPMCTIIRILLPKNLGHHTFKVLAGMQTDQTQQGGFLRTAQTVSFIVPDLPCWTIDYYFRQRYDRMANQCLPLSGGQYNKWGHARVFRQTERDYGRKISAGGQPAVRVFFAFPL